MATEQEIENKLVEHLLRGLPTFEHVVAWLKKQKYRGIKKTKCSVEMDRGPSGDSEDWLELSNEKSLYKPNYWIPVVHDGYEWVYFPCCPPWLQSRATEGTHPPRARLSDEVTSPNHEEMITTHPEEFLKQELMALESESPKFQSQAQQFLRKDEDELSDDDVSKMLRSLALPPDSVRQTHARIAVEELSRALQEGKKNLVSSIARAFVAGRHAERSYFFGASIPEVARRGKKLVDQQSLGRQGRSLPKEKKLKKWEKALAKSLRQLAASPPTKEVINSLEEAGVLTKLKNGKMRLRGESKPLARNTVEKKIRKITTNFF